MCLIDFRSSILGREAEKRTMQRIKYTRGILFLNKRREESETERRARERKINVERRRVSFSRTANLKDDEKGVRVTCITTYAVLLTSEPRVLLTEGGKLFKLQMRRRGLRVSLLPYFLSSLYEEIRKRVRVFSSVFSISCKIEARKNVEAEFGGEEIDVINFFHVSKIRRFKKSRLHRLCWQTTSRARFR